MKSNQVHVDILLAATLHTFWLNKVASNPEALCKYINSPFVPQAIHVMPWAEAPVRRIVELAENITLFCVPTAL